MKVGPYDSRSKFFIQTSSHIFNPIIYQTNHFRGASFHNSSRLPVLIDSSHTSNKNQKILARTNLQVQHNRFRQQIGTGSAAMAPNQTQVREYTEHKSPASPSPSASIILVSPSNKILLLHRVQTSSAFPSAHVFPGGNLEKTDGELPIDPKDVMRHKDNLAYRTGAIRELFEESGILLARESATSKQLLEVSASDRRRGRKAIHGKQIQFTDWLRNQSTEAVLDVDNLIPFTHWVTPPNVPKRFTTQMYVYFIPIEEAGNTSVKATSDEIETMSAEWDRAGNWVRRAQAGDVILFPPQFLLLDLVSSHLDKDGNISGEADQESLIQRREELKHFIETDGQPPWRDKFISPIGLQFGRKDGKVMLGLDKVGPELKDSGLKGDDIRVILVNFRKDGPRQLEVRERKQAMEESRQWKEEQEKNRKSDGNKL